MVNYPHKLFITKRQTSLSQPKNFANRGMSFEKMINATNDYYLSHGLAVIHKKPTLFKSNEWTLIHNEVVPRIVEAIFDKLQRRTILAFIMDITSTLKPRKQKQKRAIPMKIFIHIRFSIWNKSLPNKESALSFFTFSSQQETYLIAGIRFDSLLSSR